MGHAAPSGFVLVWWSCVPHQEYHRFLWGKLTDFLVDFYIAYAFLLDFACTLDRIGKFSIFLLSHTHLSFYFQTEQRLHLRPLFFYLPKIFLCGLIWIDLLLAQGEVYSKFLLASYLIYFSIIVYSLAKMLPKLKKSYKTIVQVTISCVIVSVVLIFLKNYQKEWPVLYVA